MQRVYLLILALVFSWVQISFSQNLTLEDIFASNKFLQNGIHQYEWYKDTDNYIATEEDKEWSLVLKDIKTQKTTKTILKYSEIKWEEDKYDIDGFQFSNQFDKVILWFNQNDIYRYSFLADYVIIDLETKKQYPLEDKQISHCTFSPDGSKVAYVKENNIYIVDIKTGIKTAVTQDGEIGKIINGKGDWVYEEEFETVKAFEWSEDGNQLVYLRFDETEVPSYDIQYCIGEPYPLDYTFKYPKAGEKNAIVSVRYYDLKNNTHYIVFEPGKKEIYVPRVRFADGNILYHTFNRNQDSLIVYKYNIKNKSTSILYTENASTYVDLYEWRYYSDLKKFFFISEMSGFKHIYTVDLNTNKVDTLTKGNWEVIDFIDYDTKKNTLFYTSNEKQEIETHFFSINTISKQKKQLTNESGTHTVAISKKFTYFINEHSVHDQGLTVYLRDINGNIISTLEKNANFKNNLKKYISSELTFSKFENVSKDKLNYYLIKPKNFDVNKKYPLLMYLYGGPGNSQVQNQWLGRNRLWFEYLSQKGYLIACLDNRGTGLKGREFKHATTMQLGKLESEDQIAFAKYMASLPYIDKDRIGLFGWSYGGYLSSLCLLLGNDVFKAAIAVAPVTNWRFYDTIYTERYLKNPKDNAVGYDQYSPITHADKLKGNLLLIHGTADDNVHFQNTVEFQNALIESNKQFESFFYPNKDHAINGRKTRLHLYTLMTNFILKKL